jgi:hypothetical protein
MSAAASLIALVIVASAMLSLFVYAALVQPEPPSRDWRETSAATSLAGLSASWPRG